MFKLLKSKTSRDIYSEGKLLRFLINKETKTKNGYLLEGTCYILGICSFDCQFFETDLLELQKHIPLFEQETQVKTIINSLNNLCPKIDTDNKIPFAKLVYLFTNSAGSNLSKFYKKLIVALDKENIVDTNERTNILLRNLVDNREVYLEYFNNLNAPLNEWIFSNSNINSKFNRYGYIKQFIPFTKDFTGFRINDYINLTSFNELYNLITGNKDIIFKKDLEKYLLNNLIVSMLGKYTMNFVNLELFEKLRTIFSLSGSEEVKSIKELDRYLNKINNICLDAQSVFLSKEINLRESLINFCESFKENGLEVLSKTNIAYHLIDGQLEVLNEYHKTFGPEKISVKKEKKLYYFMSHLSKKLSQSLNKELLLNNNEDFSSELLDLETESFSIKTVRDSKELLEIGIELNNCAGNIETLKDYQSKYTYIIEDNHGNKYLGTIENVMFDQLKGYKNASPDFNLFSKVFNLLKKSNHVKSENEHIIKNKYKKDSILESIYNKTCIHRLDIA